MRFKLYMDMAIALKSKTADIIKTGQDLAREILTDLLLFGNDLHITFHKNMILHEMLL